MRGAGDDVGELPIAGSREARHLDAVVGVLPQVVQNGRHGRQPRDLGKRQVGHRFEARVRSIQHLKIKI